MTFQIVIWDFNWEMWYQIWYRDMGYISEIGYEIWLVEVSWSQNVPMYCSAKKFRYNHETSNTHILDPISDMYSISRYEIWYHISQLKSHISIWNVIEKRGLRPSSVECCCFEVALDHSFVRYIRTADPRSIVYWINSKTMQGWYQILLNNRLA